MKPIQTIKAKLLELKNNHKNIQAQNVANIIKQRIQGISIDFVYLVESFKVK